MKNKNILEICLSPDLGGLELFMLRCFEKFKTKTECKVMVAKGKKLDNYLENEERYFLKRDKFFPFIPALKLARFIDDNEIDFIHFHWTRDMLSVVLAKKFSKKKPKIMQTRNMTMTRFKDDFYHRWLYKNIDILHAVTYQVQEQIEKFIPSDIRPHVAVIYMGTSEKKVDMARVDSLKQKYNLKDSFVVGIVGRIEEGKGQYIVIEAINKLKHLDMKAVIVGHTMDEEYLNSLKLRVKELAIEEKIVFTGFTKEVDEHMKLCDSVVLATQKETFGLVVIEAMVNKACMIAADSGGPLEIIDDKIDGLLFDRSSEDLASKLEILYGDSELKTKLAQSGYEKAKKMFDADTQIEKLYRVIDES
ncbi:MAG: glycosyltransferase family 4 protein [Campylobacterota bacterium]|nr:glycosyltransferase family 4 protein [Campylobacterota bacterium]